MHETVIAKLTQISGPGVGKMPRREDSRFVVELLDKEKSHPFYNYFQCSCGVVDRV